MTAVSIREGRVCIRGEGPVLWVQKHPDLAPMNMERKPPGVSFRVMANSQEPHTCNSQSVLLLPSCPYFKKRRNSLRVDSWQRMWDRPVLILAAFVLHMSQWLHTSVFSSTQHFVLPDFSRRNERRHGMKKSISYWKMGNFKVLEFKFLVQDVRFEGNLPGLPWAQKTKNCGTIFLFSNVFIYCGSVYLI